MSSSDIKLTDHKALIFDVYGTLCDWETGLYNALQPLLLRYPASKKWTRKEALTAFSSVETDLQSRYPTLKYSDLLAKVHEVLEQRLKALCGQSVGVTTLEDDPASTAAASSEGASTSAEGSSSAEASASASSDTADNSDAHRAFGNSIKDWSIFPDSSEALHRLSKHFKLVVLSNVDHNSFCYTHALLSEGPSSSPDISIYSYPSQNPHKYWHPQETKGSKSPFSLVLTAEDTYCYKPALEGFNVALDYIGSEPSLFGGSEVDVKSKVLSVAQSLPHDHEPASRLGMRSVWIDRQGAVTCNETPGGPNTKKKWTWRFKTLGEMADTVEEELAAAV